MTPRTAVPATAPATGVRTPALYECVVSHARTAPVHHSLRHRTYLWLVDLDRPPRLPPALRPLARFDPGIISPAPHRPSGPVWNGS